MCFTFFEKDGEKETPHCFFRVKRKYRDFIFQIPRQEGGISKYEISDQIQYRPEPYATKKTI